MRPSVRSRLVLAVSAALLASTVACSDAGDSAEAGVVTTSLGQLPISLLDEDGAELRVGDLDVASDLAALDRPDRADADAVDGWWSRLNAATPTDGDWAPSFVPRPSLLVFWWFSQTIGMIDDTFGWSPADVTWFAEHLSPAGGVVVMGGDFPADRLSAAMGPSSDGTWVVGDDRSTEYAARTIGVAQRSDDLRIWSVDDRFAVAQTADDIDAMRNHDSDDDSMVSHPHVAPLAAALDDVGVHGATLLIGGDFTLDPDRRPLIGESFWAEPEDGLDELVLAAPFVALGVGNAVDDEGPMAVLTYLHDDRDAAERNAAALDDILRTRRMIDVDSMWSSAISEIEVDVRGHGDLTLVTAHLRLLEGASPAPFHAAIDRRDSLALHR